MKRIKVSYSIRNNFGNSLNPLIFNRILGVNIEWASPFECDMTAISSGLRLMYRTPQKMAEYLNGEAYLGSHRLCCIWSSGFLDTPTGEELAVRPNTLFSLVRGELSRKNLELIHGMPIDIPTADAGLLASELINKQPIKYTLGIIPHIREISEMEYIKLISNIPGSTLIDVREDPITITKKIAQCQCIISSSLHGLVVADSLGVPNKRVVLTNKLLGDGFKFNDYYSAFGVASEYIDLRQNCVIHLNDIVSSYRITEAQVCRKKQLILDAFNDVLAALS